MCVWMLQSHLKAGEEAGMTARRTVDAIVSATVATATEKMDPCVILA